MSIDIERTVRRANTVPTDEALEAMYGDDIAGNLLSAIQHERNGQMTGTRETTTERELKSVSDKGPMRTRNSRWLAAVALALIVVGSAVLLARSLTADDVVAPDIAVVTEMLDTFYAQDMDFESYFVDEGTRREFATWAEFFFGLNLTGEYTCERTNVTPGFVTCETTSQNELAELAGLEPVAGVATFVVENDLIASVKVGPDGIIVNDGMSNLLEQHAAWIHANHEDVWSSAFGETCEYADGANDCVHFISQVPPWKTTRENGPVMVALLPEFMDSNANWPRTN